MKKIVIVMGVCFLSTLSFFSGCINVPKEFTQFSIVSFDVEPGIINQGDFANLSWVVINASSINIDHGIGNVALTGHRLIQPMQTTTYILTASNATTTKSATATITVKHAQQTATITDTIEDVSLIDYSTGETSVITYSPDISVDNLDIIEATYTKQNTAVTLTLQVRGVIEDRGKFLDPNAPDIPDIYKYNKLEYGFELSTSADDYSVTYCNKTGQIIIGGVEQINLTSSDFSVNGNALSLFFSLSSADETYTSLTATTTYIKANLSSVDSGFTYLSDVAPNPPLSVIEAFAYDTGLIGEGIQFNATIEPLTGQPPYTYHWDFGDQGTSTQLNPTHVYTKAGHYTYTFTVTDQAGNTASQTGTITIKP